MPLRVELAEAAQAEVDAIQLYLALQNTGAALRVVDRIVACLNILAEHPLAGREPLTGAGHKLPVSGTPYLIYYDVYEDLVLVTHVVHGARRWPQRTWDEDE